MEEFKMSIEIKDVNDLNGLIDYLAYRLDWNINFNDFENIEDITYGFDADDLGIKEEAFAKIISLRQLPPLVDGQKWGIFCVEFDSKRFEVSALRKILSGLIPKRRNSTEHAVWKQKDLLFICFWGRDNERTIGFAHFEDVDTGLPQIKMISCCPSVEDFTQISVFENRLKNLKWPSNYVDHNKWQSDWSSAFVTGYKQTIKDSATLTYQLANEARDIKNRILEIFKVETSNGYVHLLYDKFRNTLIHDMSEAQFADMYAQTVVYGLFSARCMDKTQEDFSAAEAIELIPNTNPFLKSLMRDCLGAQNTSKLSFDELEIGNIVDLLLHTKTDSIIEDFNRQTGGGREDPVIHFYEEFLSVYDKNQKINRGVFYTPQPIVRFIVNAVDHILKTEFGCEDGLASTDTKSIKYLRDSKRTVNGVRTKVEDTKEVPAIQILDPATGTGTFLRETILRIYDNFKSKYKHLNNDEIQKLWNEYVPKHLLPRINGFEIMMAPYAVAHMKLAMVLKDTGYDFNSNERLQVFLTNTLEEPSNSDDQLSLWDDPLAMESISANGVKKNRGINVIIGNPPYSGISSNSNNFINTMIEDYKYINGVYFRERKHWLHDDYVKFIRFSESYIESGDYGIVAFINNHSYIDNTTFRCMRWHLLNSFDKLYILDLHGSTKKHAALPDGENDENVFDIQQGVSINIFVKKLRQPNSRKELGKVFHHNLYGSKESKFNWLKSNEISNIPWKTIEYSSPFYFFVERDETNRLSWENCFSIKDIMPCCTSGIVTARDPLVIDMDRDNLLRKIHKFVDPKSTDDEIRKLFFAKKKEKKYLPGDTREWKLSQARVLIRNFNHEKYIREIAYRPFDNRFIYFCSEMVAWPRLELMSVFESQKNIALVVTRQCITDDWANVFLAQDIVESTLVSNRTKEIDYVFPLYLNNGSSNFSTEFLTKVSSKTGLNFNKLSSETTFSSMDLFNYIYAVLFSPQYRNLYKDQLKSEYPHIPIPNDKILFRRLVELGERLKDSHLLKAKFAYNLKDNFHGTIPCLINYAKFDKNRIYIAKDSYFDCIKEEDWNFYIGCYQPLQKWLKDRKGRLADIKEINHYAMIIGSIKETQIIMRELALIC